jgi:hypothetical protein
MIAGNDYRYHVFLSQDFVIHIIGTSSCPVDKRIGFDTFPFLLKIKKGQLKTKDGNRLETELHKELKGISITTEVG